MSCFNAVYLTSKHESFFFIGDGIPLTEHEARAKGILCYYRQPEIFNKLLKTKAQCSSDQAMVYIKNSMYAADQENAPRITVRPSVAVPLPNLGVLSAVPCI